MDSQHPPSSSLLPTALLTHSPSLQDGVCVSEEVRQRVLGCELVQEATILLRLPQAVAATGQLLLHRFFYRKSLTRFDVFTVAMGCVLLASKVEEKPRILREVLYVFFHMFHLRKDLPLTALELGGQCYSEWKSEVVTVERFILKELGFCFYQNIEHPHKYLLYYIKVLNGTNDLAQRSWNYLNDSSRLDLLLHYRTSVVACASIHLAALDLKFPLPTSECVSEGVKECGSEWWRLFGVQLEDVIAVAKSILHLYTLPKVRWLEPLAAVPYLSSTEESATTALTHSLATTTTDSNGVSEVVEDSSVHSDISGKHKDYSDRSSERVRDKELSHDRDSERVRERVRDRDRSRERDSERVRERVRDRDRSRERDSERVSERVRDRDRSRDRGSERVRNRDRSRDRESERVRDRVRDRDRSRDRGSERVRERGSGRSGRRHRSRSRSRSRGGERRR